MAIIDVNIDGFGNINCFGYIGGFGNFDCFGNID